MTADEVKVFAIVVSYKGHRWYDRCFSSLRESSLPIKTIVVDNASNDGTIEYIKGNFPEIHLIESKENLGFGRANNIGMRYALDHGCDYVFLLNQDAWIEPDTIERLISIHKRHPEYGILGPVQTNAERTRVLDDVVMFLINPNNYNKELFSDLLIGTKKEIYPVSEINAAAWLLPRNVLETVGGFDPIFLHYGEDWNYLSRVLYHNLKVGLTPEIHVVHDCKERVEKPQDYNMNFEKWLLQRATDILYPDSQVDDMMQHYCKKALSKLLVFHKKAFKENWKAYMYLKRNRERINNSRNQNKELSKNWL